MLPLSVLIPTLNEAANVSHAIESVLGWAQQVFVLDSLSSDETRQVVARHPEVELVEHRFESYSRQWNWALDNLPFRTSWVFLLAADERPSDELKRDIEEAFERLPGSPREPYAGYYVARLNHFLGQPLYHGGTADAHTLRIWQHSLGRFEDRSVNEHVILNGPARRLRGFLLHEDRKGIEAWLARHNRYSTLEALEALRRDQSATDNKIGFDAGWRRKVLKSIWPYVPAKSFAYFCYAYFWRLGLLDGSAGYHYARLRSQYLYWIEVKKLESRLNGLPASASLPQRKSPV